MRSRRPRAPRLLRSSDRDRPPGAGRRQERTTLRPSTACRAVPPPAAAPSRRRGTARWRPRTRHDSAPRCPRRRGDCRCADRHASPAAPRPNPIVPIVATAAATPTTRHARRRTDARPATDAGHEQQHGDARARGASSARRTHPTRPRPARSWRCPPRWHGAPAGCASSARPTSPAPNDIAASATRMGFDGREQRHAGGDPERPPRRRSGRIHDTSDRHPDDRGVDQWTIGRRRRRERGRRTTDVGDGGGKVFGDSVTAGSSRLGRERDRTPTSPIGARSASPCGRNDQAAAGRRRSLGHREQTRSGDEGAPGDQQCVVVVRTGGRQAAAS